MAKQYARIKIVDCDGRLWGVVAWEAQPGIDNKNPDRALRSRPTLGMPILLGMTPTKTNQWDGQIYNSQDGHTYSANISLVGREHTNAFRDVFSASCAAAKIGRALRRKTPWGRLRPHHAKAA